MYGVSQGHFPGNVGILQAFLLQQFCQQRVSQDTVKVYRTGEHYPGASSCTGGQITEPQLTLNNLIKCRPTRSAPLGNIHTEAPGMFSLAAKGPAS